MKGDLKVQFEKNGKNLERKLNPDRSYISKDGKGLKTSWKKFTVNKKCWSSYD